MSTVCFFPVELLNVSFFVIDSAKASFHRAPSHVALAITIRVRGLMGRLSSLMHPKVWISAQRQMESLASCGLWMKSRFPTSAS